MTKHTAASTPAPGATAVVAAATKMADKRAYRGVLALSLLLIVAGLTLTVLSVLSPSWQVSFIEEVQERHYHGLWWDCVRSSAQLVPLNQVAAKKETATASGEGAERCHYKLDEAADERVRVALERGDRLAEEGLLHRFLPQHKAVLFFAVFTLVFGVIGLLIGLCSPCFPPNSLLYVVALFMTTACSALADVIFLHAASKSSWAQGTVKKYPNSLGFAAYLHVGSSLVLALGLSTAVAAAHLLISSAEPGHCCLPHATVDWLEAGAGAAASDEDGRRYSHRYTLQRGAKDMRAWRAGTGIGHQDGPPLLLDSMAL